MDTIIDALDLSGIRYEKVNDNEVFLPNWEGGTMSIVYDPISGYCEVTQTWRDTHGHLQTAVGTYPARNAEAWFNY